MTTQELLATLAASLDLPTRPRGRSEVERVVEALACKETELTDEETRLTEEAAILQVQAEDMVKKAAKLGARADALCAMRMQIMRDLLPDGIPDAALIAAISIKEAS